MTSTHVQHQEDTEIPKNSQKISRDRPRHKIVLIACVSALVAGLAAGGGGLALNQFQHQKAAQGYTASVTTAGASYKANNSAHKKFASTKSDATLYHETAQSILDGSNGYLDDDATKEFSATVTQLGDDLEIQPGSTRLSRLDPPLVNATTEQYKAATLRLRNLENAVKKDTESTSKASSTIHTSQETSETALVKLAHTVDVTKATVLTANPQASTSTKDAFTTAADEITTSIASKNKKSASSKQLPTLFVTYLTAGKALTDENTAVLAAQQAEAAKSAAPGSKSSTLQRSNSGSQSGSSPSGGGTSSTSGGTTNGNTSGGGGSQSSTSNWAPAKIDYGTKFSACPAEAPVAWDATGSASYGSYIVIPSPYLSAGSPVDTGTGWKISYRYCGTW